MNYRTKKLHVYLLIQSAQGMQEGWGGMINKNMDASEAVYIRGNVLDIVRIRE